MGLLDIFNTEQGRMGLGLLAAGSARGDGAGFGQRLSEAVGSVDQWKQQQAQAKRAKMQEEFQAFQMQQAMAQAKAQEAAQEAAKRQQAGIPGLFRATQTQGQVSIPQMGGVDMFSQGAKVETPSMRGPAGFDVQGALALGLTPDMIEKYASLNNIGKQEAKDWQDIEGPNGAKIRQAFDKYGQPIGSGVNGYVAPVQVNQGGGGITFAKPVAGANFPVTMTASEKDASARGWAGVKQGDQRLALERDKAVNPRAAGPMSVTLQKELLESDDLRQSSQSIINTLGKAKEINKDAYSGYFAKGRATLASNVWPGKTSSADATIDLDNLMTGQGLDQMKLIFGAAPTEGERKILMDMQASADKTPKQREAIMDRAIEAATRRGAYADRKAKAIRAGTYLTDGVPESIDSPKTTAPKIRRFNLDGTEIKG